MKFSFLTLAASLAIILSSCSSTNQERDMYRELKSVDKMVFASMSINKTARLDDNEWYKPGKRIAVYSYNTYLRAFIDLSELQTSDIVFDERARTVKVTLPPVRTEVAGRDIHLHKEYENIGLLRHELDSKERAEIKEIANESFRREVVGNTEFKRLLTDEAKRKARRYIETLMESQGYAASVDFKHDNSL